MEQPPEGDLTQHSPAANRFVGNNYSDADLARDSAGQVHPHYDFTPRSASRLARGELVREPALGLVRVATVPDTSCRPHHVWIGWASHNTPCHAMGSYPTQQRFDVRGPAQADQLLIRQGIDQANWARRQITGDIARLIAAHTYLSPRSALYNFAVFGEIPLVLYDELRTVNRYQPGLNPWIQALGRYCTSRRTRREAIPGWGPQPPDGDEFPPDPGPPPRASARRHKPTGRISPEMASKLTDAAFALGFTLAGSRVTAEKARRILASHALERPPA
ncbi:MAG TPA: hypothetical protein VLI54_02985 [Bacillota bacterium]|nr:hypothetical protein [Bacillota bacterium]